MALMLEPLRKYADFQGRARRAEYWLFQLGVWIFMICAVAVVRLGGESTLHSLVGVIISIAFSAAIFGLMVPSFAVLVRRLHDTNRSGWWILISFLPFLGSFILLALTLFDGTPNRNRFGPDPKGRGDTLVSAFN